jgi:hypothetical protein
LGEPRLKGWPGRLVRAALLVEDLLAELVALEAELVLVEQHAVALHAVEHRQDGHLDLAVHEVQPSHPPRSS